MDLDFPPSGNTRVPAARKPRREEYHVGIICALAIEHAAVVGMLDEAYPTLSTVHGDDNHYAFGRIGLHNVVVACLPAGVTGTVSATRVASNMQRTFRDIKVGLMVGIGGGVPSTQRDIRLGDVVVSQPEGAHGGVVQWDFGRTEAGGCFRRTRTLNKPPAGLLHALQAIQSRTFTDGIDLNECLSFMAGAKPLLMDRCRYPGAENDCLFVASYEHVPGSTCEGCDKTQVVHRQTRPSTSPCVHYGNIASGNQVMKDAVTRDRIGDRENIICFEMEAAGLMDDFPCLVIRGICDYADSHKNDEWQPYAAAAAAAFARMLLRDFIQPSGVSQSACDGRVLSDLPFKRNKGFVGRHEQLARIEEKMFSEDSIFAIFGLGGIGKTQIALELAYRTLDRHPECSIFWIHSASRESFRQAYEEIAKKLGIFEDCAQDIDTIVMLQKYLSQERSGQWLMILDNADDRELWFDCPKGLPLSDYVPQSRYGCVVMTTRDERMAITFAGADGSIEVEQMNEETATAMLRNILSRKHLVDDVSHTSELLSRLCFLPLAIVQAGAYININHRAADIAKYVKLLDSTDGSRLELLAKKFGDKARYGHQQNAITTTWLISFDKIREQNPLAAEYLTYMAFFDHKRVPEDLLPAGPSEQQEIDALSTLFSYSFVTRQENGGLDMHRLVHLITRNWLRSNGTYDESVSKAVGQLLKVFGGVPSESRELWRAYLPHVQQALGQHTDPKDEKFVNLCGLYGHRLTIEGRYSEAEQCLRKVLDIRTRLLGEAHSLTILSRHRLCYPLLEEHRYKAVEIIYRDLVGITTMAHGPEDERTLEAVNLVGWTLWKQRRWAEAENLFARLVEDQERLLGRGHHQTIKSKSNLATNLVNQRKWQEAEAILRDVLQSLSDGDSDWEDGDTFCQNIYRDKESLVDILLAQDRLVEAEELQWEVINSTAQIKGLEKCTLRSKCRLLSMLRDQERTPEADKLQAEITKEGDILLRRTATAAESKTVWSMQKHAEELAEFYQWEDAHALYKELIYTCLEIAGEESSQTLNYRIQATWALHQQGQYDKAEADFLSILEKATNVLDPAHPDMLLCKSLLVDTYLKQKKFDSAHELKTDILRIKTAQLGERDHATLEQMRELPYICDDRGATDAAVRLQEDLTELKKLAMGSGHPDTLQSMETLAEMYHKSKRCKEAQKIEQELLELMRAIRGPAHPDTLSLIKRLVQQFHEHGLRTEEETLLITSHDDTSKFNGPDHPDTLACMRSLASFYHKHGSCEKSEIYQREVYGRTKRLKGPDDPDTLSDFFLLVGTYRCIKKPEKAEQLLLELIARHRTDLGQSHEKTLVLALTKLAWICYEQKRFQEAEHLRKEIFDRTRASKGANHPDTLKAMDQWGVMIWNQNRFQDAEAIFSELVETCKQALSPGDLQTLQSSTNLGVTLMDLGRFEDAELHLQFVREAGTGRDAAKEVVQKSLLHLVDIRRRTGRSEEAFELMEEYERYAGNGAREQSEESEQSDGSEQSEESDNPDDALKNSDIVEDPMELDDNTEALSEEAMAISRKRKASGDPYV